MSLLDTDPHTTVVALHARARAGLSPVEGATVHADIETGQENFHIVLRDDGNGKLYRIHIFPK